MARSISLKRKVGGYLDPYYFTLFHSYKNSKPLFSESKALKQMVKHFFETTTTQKQRDVLIVSYSKKK